MKRYGPLAAGLCLLLGSCGYKVGVQGDLVPKAVKTIAIPAFGNATIRYKLTYSVPEALAREFITRTKYRVVSEQAAPDAIPRGVITN